MRKKFASKQFLNDVIYIHYLSRVAMKIEVRNDCPKEIDGIFKPAHKIGHIPDCSESCQILSGKNV